MTTTKIKAAKATTEYDAELDPAALLLDGNVRTKVNKDAGFAALAASVAELGVVQPITVWRPDTTAPMTVLRGQRRTLAALDAGKDVPGIIITGPEDEAKRISDGLAENLHREDLTAADTAAAVAALFDLKVPAARVAKITGIGRKSVTQARQVAGDPAALEAARKHAHLTLDEAAAIAEFADEPEVAEHLAGQAGARNFSHIVQQQRDKRAEKAAAVKLTAKLEADGYTVYQAGDDQGTKLWALTDDTESKYPQAISEDDHTQCEGRAALIIMRFNGPQWVGRCLKPELHHQVPGMGMTGGSSGRGGGMNEAQKAERRQVIDNNRAWRSAETVRRAWLADFAHRVKAPADALGWVLECVTRADWKMVDSTWAYNKVGLTALGIDAEEARKAEDRNPEQEDSTMGYTSAMPAGKPTVLAMLAAAKPAGRGLVIVCALLLGAYEADLSVQTWRSITPSRRAYMERLTAWGYEPSDVERIVLDGRLDRHVHKDGEVTFLKTDEQIAEEAKAAQERAAEFAAARAAVRPVDRSAHRREDSDEEDEAAGEPDVTIGVSVAQPGDDDEPETFPRIIAGRWVDRAATEEDPEDELIYPEGDGPAWHIAGNEEQLDADAGVQTGEGAPDVT
jgi:ParB family chromosome partitioning protein